MLISGWHVTKQKAVHCAAVICNVTSSGHVAIEPSRNRGTRQSSGPKPQASKQTCNRTELEPSRKWYRAATDLQLELACRQAGLGLFFNFICPLGACLGTRVGQVGRSDAMSRSSFGFAQIRHEHVTSTSYCQNPHSQNLS